MLHHFIKQVTTYPKTFLALSLATALFFGAFAPFLQIANNVDQFTLESDPDKSFYEAFKRTFGNDEFFVIAFERPDIFTPENLHMIRTITEKLEQLADVRRVVSLANVNETRGGEEDFEVRPFLESIPEDPHALRDLKNRALNNPLFLRQIISTTGTTTAIVVFTKDRPDDPDYRVKLLEQTQALLEPYGRQNVHFHLAGWTLVNVSLSRYMIQDVFLFIPITYALIGVTILWIFRNAHLTLLALANLTACLAATMGFFRLCGITLNNVTVIVPPLVMALSLSDTVHIFSHMHRSVLTAEQNNHRRALARVLSLVIRPSYLTTLTTFLGFLSLGISRIPPIRDFAWTASMGMVFEFFFAFGLLPPLILCFPSDKLYKDSKGPPHTERFLDGAQRLVLGRPRTITLICLASMLLGAFLAIKIRVETNLIDYFKPSDPLRRSLNFVQDHLAGVGSLDVVLSAAEPDTFKEPEIWQAVEAMQKDIQSLAGVDKTLSLVDFLKDMNQAFHGDDPNAYRLPESRRLIAQYLLLYDADDLQDVVNESYDKARIAVRLSEHRSSRQAQIISAVKQIVAQHAPASVQARVTGRAVQNVNTIDALIMGQLQSLALAVVLIWAAMITALRSWTLGLLSLLPNLFPIVLNFGLMGLLSIPLNTATALIAAVAIGMAVDNTIHFLSVYAQNLASGHTRASAITTVMLEKGPAMVWTTLILFTGFGVLVCSHFQPTVQFGILSVVLLLWALVGDLVFLPAILACPALGFRREALR